MQLTTEDYKKIEAYIEKWANLPSHPHKPVEEILKPWQKAKKEYLYDLFGRNFIISQNVKVEKPQDLLLSEMKQFLYTTKADRFLMALARKIKNDAAFEEISSPHNLTQNRIQKEIDVTCPDGKVLRYAAGTRTIKIIRKLAESFAVPGYEEFQTGHSAILNQKTLSGELCLSIHPLDYMTMSDNDSNWSSCMSWKRIGGYRSGTIEMMNSPCVIVAYLRGEHDMHAAGPYTWNNKKWRSLFVVTPDFITSVKGYPYQNDELNQIVIEWLAQLGRENLGWDISDKVYPYEHNTTFMVNNHSVKLRFRTFEWMYNDFGSIEHHQCALPQSLDEDLSIDFYYGGTANCMCCGGFLEVDEEENLCCLSCEPTTICAHCDARIYDTDDAFCLEGDYFCDDCFAEYIRHDAVTQSYYYDPHYELTIDIAIRDNDQVVWWFNTRTTSPHSLYWDKLFKIPCPRLSPSDRFYLNLEDCRPAALELFYLN